jgi:hypothetical protein
MYFVRLVAYMSLLSFSTCLFAAYGTTTIGYIPRTTSKKHLMHEKILNSRPTLAEIEDVILPFLGEDWHRVGEFLRISKKVMREIESKYGSVPKLCSEAMFSQWLNHEEGTGPEKRTWNAVQWALHGTRRNLLFGPPNHGLAYTYAWFKLQKHLDLKVEEGLCIEITLEKETMCRKILNSRPTIAEIENLILQYLGEDWHRVGEFLRISKKVMREIESKYGSVPKLCSEAMFSQWLNHEEGTGPEKRTWNAVQWALHGTRRNLLFGPPNHGLAYTYAWFKLQKHLDLKVEEGLCIEIS